MPASKAASATRACTRSPVLSHCENDSTNPTRGHEKLSLADKPSPTCQDSHPIQSARGMTGTRADGDGRAAPILEEHPSGQSECKQNVRILGEGRRRQSQHRPSGPLPEGQAHGQHRQRHGHSVGRDQLHRQPQPEVAEHAQHTPPAGTQQ